MGNIVVLKHEPAPPDGEFANFSNQRPRVQIPQACEHERVVGHLGCAGEHASVLAMRRGGTALRETRWTDQV